MSFGLILSIKKIEKINEEIILIVLKNTLKIFFPKIVSESSKP